MGTDLFLRWVKIAVLPVSILALLIGSATAQAGGWATVVLNELPEFVVRDKAVNVISSVKQCLHQPGQEVG